MGFAATGGATGVVHDHLRRSQRFNTLFMAGLPLLTLVVQPAGAALTAGLVLGLMVCVAVHCAAIGWGVTLRPGLVEQVEWLLVVGSVVLALVAFTQLPTGWVWLIVPGTAAADLTGLRRPIRPMLWSVSIAAATGIGVLLLTWDDAGLSTAALSAAGSFAFVLVVGYGEATGPLLAQRTAEAQQARERLATLEERTRIAEGLHDVLGRALEVVAFKSELADRVMAQAPDRARQELRDMRDVAQRAVADMRAVVRDVEEFDVAREVDSARALLESAGVDVEVTGDAGALPPHARGLLGRVLREGVTNAMRHAHAATVRLGFDVTENAVTLTMSNDGVAGGEARPSRGSGTGLATLRGHLRDAGGDLHVTTASETYELRATLPRDARESGTT